eukprot:TRINITY_DN4939_c0_g1_i5.p2 TRINITY_DN4939_c0_g1~~TRINITY_DN4939_c0_g1_i5.p2  ORF type:complete len:332 (-),score=32.89 TRINITY_DN4939_c0_g1_i5:253-1248(-)
MLPQIKTAIGSNAQVIGTNDDAQISKLSCVNLGYFKDEFLQFFVRKPQKRSPLINRGYYSRFAIIRKILMDFLAQNASEKQVISLGAGFDTTWFQLYSEGITPRLYLEIDFANVFQRKAQVILATPALQQMVYGDQAITEQIKQDALGYGRVSSEKYRTIPTDLRNLEQLQEELQKINLQFNLPTLILSECCLVYLEPEDSQKVVNYFGTHFDNAIIVVYEQICPDDAFGKQMVMNLEQRGCPLRGLKATPTTQAHIERLIDNGWQRGFCKDMDRIYREVLDKNDRKRIEKLEIFDEFEEWHMIQQHYCISVAINDAVQWSSRCSFQEYLA